MKSYAPDNLEQCCPDALVRRIYDADFYVLNGERAPTPVRTRTVKYECAGCGRELKVNNPLKHAAEISGDVP